MVSDANIALVNLFIALCLLRFIYWNTGIGLSQYIHKPKGTDSTHQNQSLSLL